MWMRKSKRCQVWRIRCLRGDDRGRRCRERRMETRRIVREKRRESRVVREKREGGEAGEVVIEAEAVIG